MPTSEHETFRIYVASLADYNAGILHGTWIDFDHLSSIDDILPAIFAMLDASPTAKESDLPAEEWAIHDYEGWCGFEIDGHGYPAGLWLAYEVLSEMCENYSPAAIHDYAEWAGKGIYDIDDHFKDEFEDAYCGQYDDEEAFAESYIEDTGTLSTIPEWARAYFDYEAFARDLFMTDYFMTDDGHVFHAC